MSKARPVNASMPFMRAGGVDVAADVVEAVEQVLAVVQALGGRRRWPGAGSAGPGRPA